MKEKPKLTVKELERLLSAEFPQMFDPQSGYGIEEVWFGGSRIRKHFSPRSLRPGGTIAGTTMMTLADFAPYVAILASIGWVPLAVTTNLTINFLRKPPAARPCGRGAVDQAREKAGGRRNRHSLGGRGRPGRPCHVYLFDTVGEVK
jgi:acyl-coenzyme A thioesterase PaaI-like protein